MSHFASSVPRANFMNGLKLSQLSLCVRCQPQHRLKSVREIDPRAFNPAEWHIRREFDPFDFGVGVDMKTSK